jgi:hypothetical protein
MFISPSTQSGKSPFKSYGLNGGEWVDISSTFLEQLDVLMQALQEEEK